MEFNFIEEDFIESYSPSIWIRELILESISAQSIWGENIVPA